MLNPPIMILYASTITAIRIGTVTIVVMILYQSITLLHCSSVKGAISLLVFPKISSSYSLKPTPNSSLVVKLNTPSAIPPSIFAIIFSNSPPSSASIVCSMELDSSSVSSSKKLASTLVVVAKKTSIITTILVKNFFNFKHFTTISIT